MKVEIVKGDRVVNEDGEHVGTVMKKAYEKTWVYCFLCEKIVSGLEHFEKEH